MYVKLVCKVQSKVKCRIPSEEVHLSLSDLHSTAHGGDLNVVTEAYCEAIRKHGEHPLEVFLLRRGGQA